MPAPLISELTLELIKKALSEICDQAELTDLFGRLGIEPGSNPDFSNKASHIASYLDHQDWSNHDVVRRLLEALSKIVGLPSPTGRLPQSVRDMLLQMEEDGYKWTGKEFVKIEAVTDEASAKTTREPRLGSAQPEVEQPQPDTSTHPDDPISAAKKLIESTCKTILMARGEKVQDNDDVSSLTERTVKLLGLLSEDASGRSKGADVTRKLFHGVGILLQELAEFLSLYGDPHKRRPGTLESRHVKLIIGLAGTLSMLLMDAHEHTPLTK